MKTLKYDSYLQSNKRIKKVRGPTKKAQILEAWLGGERDIRALALDLDSTPSYVASVLQSAGYIQGYHDLYTSSRTPLNIYSQDLSEKLSFKDIESAKQSVAKLEEAYHGLGEMKDRAGQHHFLTLALIMFNRARFSRKLTEANLFRDWLVKHLMEEPRAFAKLSLV